jgi:hypothetical protein
MISGFSGLNFIQIFITPSCAKPIAVRVPNFGILMAGVFGEASRCVISSILMVLSHGCFLQPRIFLAGFAWYMPNNL